MGSGKEPELGYKKRFEMLDKGLGYCVKCKTFKSLSDFHKGPSVFGHRSRCKECINSTRRGNKQLQKTMRDRARRLTKYYIELAGNCCQKCGYNKSIAALDFHHISPSDKEHHPGVLITTGNHEKIMPELDKCVLLCSNCHREFNAGEWAAEFIKRDGLGWTIKPKSIVETSHDESLTLPDRYRYSQISLV